MPSEQMKRDDAVGRFDAQGISASRRGLAQAVVDAVHRDRSDRVARALKQASDKTGLFSRKGRALTE